MPTPRLLLLALIAPALLALSEWAPGLAPLFALYLAVLAGLVVLDLRLGDPPAAFDIRRDHDQRLSLDADNPVAITVRHRGRRDTAIELRDEPPDDWLRAAPAGGTPILFRARLAAGTAQSLAYAVHPLRRGDYHFGNITLRWACPLGLWRRQCRFPLRQAVQVYPNVQEVRKYDLLLRARRLQDVGLRVTRRYGEGHEFERLRDYLPDDDFRRISWKATARRHKPISVEYESERSQTIFVAFDTGRMMKAPVGDMDRLDYVVNAALLFSYVVLGKGDRVGLMTFGDEVAHYLEPKGGRAQFHRLIETLYRVEAQPVEPAFGRALSTLKTRQRRRALVVIFTDVTGGLSMQQLAAGAVSLRPPHLPLVVTIADPALNNMAGQAPADAAGAYERAAAQRVLDDRRAILQHLEHQGVLTLDVPASRLSAAVINRYLDIKGKGML